MCKAFIQLEDKKEQLFKYHIGPGSLYILLKDLTLCLLTDELLNPVRRKSPDPVP